MTALGDLFNRVWDAATESLKVKNISTAIIGPGEPVIDSYGSFVVSLTAAGANQVLHATNACQADN